MHEFTRGSFVFDVDDSGPRDGEVVVLLHGYPENRTSWQAVTPLLTDAGCRVLAPDQRGYSPRARPPHRRDYRVTELVADVLALIDAAGVDRVHLVGHDWGGIVAWVLAHRHPDRLHTVTSLTTPHPRAYSASLLRSTQLLHSWYVLMFQLPWLPESGMRGPGAAFARRVLVSSGLPPEAADRYVAPLQQPGAARAAINWYRGLPLSPPLVGKVEVPTLYVYATEDRFLTRTAAELTGSYVAATYRFEVLDRMNHWLPELAPDIVARLVLDHAHRHGSR
ncbi:MAG TPA: alpha/beta fold hydrolase [Mycobacteriales bacterium]|nr:alpha/beta fold hydrolase [Mycobacteriales bacterium]